MNSNEDVNYSDVYLDNIKSDFFVIKQNKVINVLMQFEEALGMPYRTDVDFDSISDVDDGEIFEEMHLVNEKMFNLHTSPENKQFRSDVTPTLIFNNIATKNFGYLWQKYVNAELKLMNLDIPITTEIYFHNNENTVQMYIQDYEHLLLADSEETIEAFIIDENSTVKQLQEINLSVAMSLLQPQYPTIAKYITNNLDTLSNKGFTPLSQTIEHIVQDYILQTKMAHPENSNRQLGALLDYHLNDKPDLNIHMHGCDMEMQKYVEPNKKKILDFHIFDSKDNLVMTIHNEKDVQTLVDKMKKVAKLEPDPELEQKATSSNKKKKKP